MLTHTGQVTLTEVKVRHRLFKHAVIEMFRRGEPPVPHNFHPSVAPAILFPDQDLCTRAAAVVARVPKQGPYLVKYGKAEHMRGLYERGELHVAPASGFDDPDHNQAVRDREFSLRHYGVVANDAGFLKARDVNENPDVMRVPDHRFVPLFHAPKAQRDEVTGFESYGPDAWMYCMSELLAPRLFSDCGADACVVLDRDAFLARVCDALRPPVGNKVFAHGPAHYMILSAPTRSRAARRRSISLTFRKPKIACNAINPSGPTENWRAPQTSTSARRSGTPTRANIAS